MAHAEDSPKGSCREFEQDLVLYHYEESTGTEHHRLEAHLEGCASCRGFLEDLRRVTSLTVKTDEPAQVFWESYSREMRRKLAALEEESLWWSTFFSFLRHWPVPALAVALVFILAVTLTFTKGLWHSQHQPAEEKALVEVQPIAENLDFFKALDFLDSLEFLEATDAVGSKPRNV